MQENKITEAVKDRYSQIAEQAGQGCCSTASCSCGCGSDSEVLSQAVGYNLEDLKEIPEEAVMGLGCGNPVSLAALNAGDTVIDLGSGAGVDVFLAAIKVGAEGRVIGVDMTEAMIDKANAIALDNDYRNVEFRLGEIEKLPVDDNSADAIISNCVINLSQDKAKVFGEAYRVLRKGGHIVISDIVSEKTLSDGMRNDMDTWSCCIGGALPEPEYLDMIRQAGFSEPEILSRRTLYSEDKDAQGMIKLFSLTVKASKP